MNEELDNAREMAEWLVENGNYTDHQGDVHRWRMSTNLVNACMGHDTGTISKAVWAFWENAETQPIKNPSGYLITLLKEFAEPSEEFEAKQKREREYRRRVEERQQQIAYTEQWIKLAHQCGLIEVLNLSTEHQHYTYKLRGNDQALNLSLWQIPGQYEHVTIEQMREYLREQAA